MATARGDDWDTLIAPNDVLAAAWVFRVVDERSPERSHPLAYREILAGEEGQVEVWFNADGSVEARMTVQKVTDD